MILKYIITIFFMAANDQGLPKAVDLVTLPAEPHY
jgi:hypothetical protein